MTNGISKKIYYEEEGIWHVTIVLSFNSSFHFLFLYQIYIIKNNYWISKNLQQFNILTVIELKRLLLKLPK